MVYISGYSKATGSFKKHETISPPPNIRKNENMKNNKMVPIPILKQQKGQLNRDFEGRLSRVC